MAFNKSVYGEKSLPSQFYSPVIQKNNQIVDHVLVHNDNFEYTIKRYRDIFIQDSESARQYYIDFCEYSDLFWYGYQGPDMIKLNRLFCEKIKNVLSITSNIQISVVLKSKDLLVGERTATQLGDPFIMSFNEVYWSLRFYFVDYEDLVAARLTL